MTRNTNKYVHFGDASGLLDGLLEGATDVIFVTDTTIAGLYPRLFGGFFEARQMILLPPGDAAKTLEHYSRVVAQLIGMGASRTTILVGVGGGAVCDFVGFVASTFMRGCPFGFVATTILAQIDAAIGGKNGLNFSVESAQKTAPENSAKKMLKNTIGTFALPDFVIIDAAFHATLPPQERLSARGEVLKYALLSGDLGLLTSDDYIERCADIKLKICGTDPRETLAGQRILLNLGHTFGHALEHCTGGQISHGQAVGTGIGIVAEISHRMGLLPQKELQKITQLIENEGLSSTTQIPTTELLQAIAHDKKHHKKEHGTEITLVLLLGIGRPTTRTLSLLELTNLLRQ